MSDRPPDAKIEIKGLGKNSTLVDYVGKLEQALIDHGICPYCQQAPEMDDDGPFASCRCGTGEDYAKRPMQRLQLLERKADE